MAFVESELSRRKGYGEIWVRTKNEDERLVSSSSGSDREETRRSVSEDSCLRCGAEAIDEKYPFCSDACEQDEAEERRADALIDDYLDGFGRRF